MQCYESEMMLAYIYNVLTYSAPEFRRNNLILADILSNTGANDIVELLKIEHAAIRQIAGPYINEISVFHRAA